MNFSKLNPLNWFRKPPEPPKKDPPGPTNTLKYHVGQRCLVLKCTTVPSVVGTEVYLVEPNDGYVDIPTGNHVSYRVWRIDIAPKVIGPTGKLYEVVYRENQLLPIDDENVNEELRNEVIDNFGTKQIELDRILQQCDKLLDQLDEQIKRRKQQQA
jgi:hypothetical protein